MYLSERSEDQEVVAMGILFSVCAGILIGLKAYFLFISQKEERREKQLSAYKRLIKDLWYGSGWPNG